MLDIQAASVIYNGKTQALNQVSVHIKSGEFIGVIGASGSGKSTLLKAITHLVPLSSGSISINGNDVSTLGRQGLKQLRRQTGFIFQDYNLITRSTVLDNVLIGRLAYMPFWRSVTALYTDADYELAQAALATVQLEEKTFEKSGALSGGQMQRVAIARALAQSPSLILADEPVSSLDQASAENVMHYFQAINAEKNITIVASLHNVDLARRFTTRILAIKKGELVLDVPAGEFTSAHLEAVYS